MTIARVNGHANQNNIDDANPPEGVRLRNGGTKLSPNGNLATLRRDLSPIRGEVLPVRREVLPESLQGTLRLAATALQDAQNKLEGAHRAVNSALRDVRSPRTSQNTCLSPDWSPTKKGRQEETTPRDKEFVPRNSPLTDLYAVSHITTIYHLAVVVLIVLVLNTLVHDLVSTGTINLSLGLVWHTFGGFHRVITIWMVMFFATLLLYASFSHWAHKRLSYPQGSVARRVWDGAWLSLLVVYDVGILVLPNLRMVHYGLPVASSFALLMEQVRLLMKSHAFIRSNAPRALAVGSATPSKSKGIVCPGFSQFLYFMLAPTLIYRDEYPRTPEIRWRLAVCYLMEVVGTMFYISFLCERFLLPAFRDFGLRPVSTLDAFALILGAVLPAGLAMLCAFYLLLHAWQNAFAEMLRFSDRMFYKDWWNQTTFSSYYRTWNLVVQDWLYAYVYKDVILLGGSGMSAKIVVFAISALVHEYILALTFRFFYPVLFIFFGIIGMVLSFVTPRNSVAAGNIGLWLSLFLGDGMLFSFYCSEHYARINCPQTIDSTWDIFIPRSWACIVSFQNATTA